MAVEKVLLKISCYHWLVIFGVLVSLLLRNITMLHPYSGQGNAPMYGDYEAQRHWMEITTNLPTKDWYKNTTDNNLDYWGLDYPPLTAYHMYLCGLVANYLNENYTKLHDSRGFESDDHKLFMRLSVFLGDILIYIPSLVLFYSLSDYSYQNVGVSKIRSKTNHIMLKYSSYTILGLLYPGIILIDHGHFQYNSISLGLTALSVLFLMHQKNILASILFCLALNYKQMELYHSLPFFFYLLSTCIPKPGKRAVDGILSLFLLGITVISTFLIIWFPFVFDLETFLQVLHRQFPFNRGIFEDKVSNFWCFLNIFYKLRTCDTAKLMRYSLFTTLTAVFPSSVDLFVRPNLRKFVLALINCSLGFFLFSYQVHEKTILVVALPVLLYFPENPFVCFWFLYISVFSMIPLFVKDNLIIATIALLSFYITAFFICMRHHYRTSSLLDPNLQFIKNISNLNTKNSGSFMDSLQKNSKEIMKNRESVTAFLFLFTMILSFFGSFLIFIVSLILNPPSRYPDLFPLIISAYSCLHFMGFFLYFNVKQVQISQDFGDIGNVKVKES